MKKKIGRKETFYKGVEGIYRVKVEVRALIIRGMETLMGSIMWEIPHVVFLLLCFSNTSVRCKDFP